RGRVGEAEDVQSFDEERPLLGIERLELREVDYGRIDFHLAEVRIDRAGERQAGCQAVLEIDARVAAHLVSADERIVSQSGAEVRPADSVGNDFERTAAVNALDAGEIGEVGDEAGLPF